MRLVLDTNVLIAALIARGVCADLLEHCILSHTLVTSEFILNELREQLIDKFKYTQQETDDAIALLTSQMEVVVPMALEQPVCRDVDDDQILATAVAGRAKCLITGENDLLILRRHAGFEILNPSNFAAFETRLQRP
jgi:putative PIN family toxin of toxin-antitoxin system